MARFEAGNADAVNSSTPSDAASANNIATKAPVSRLGVKAWNYIDYNNAATVSRLMVNDNTKYGNNRSGLITGTQWDAILAWYKADNIGVENTTQNWGSYYNLGYTGRGYSFTYDGSTISSWTGIENFSHTASTQPYLFHATGANTGSAIKKNIADIGGNLWEWTAEIYSSNRVVRGGGANTYASSYPASYRYNSTPSDTDYLQGFRATLYIK